MQNYCGGVRCEALLREGLDLLGSYERDIVPQLSCKNPHELMRIHEVLDILTVAQIMCFMPRCTESQALHRFSLQEAIIQRWTHRRITAISHSIRRTVR